MTHEPIREVTRIHEHECAYILWTANRGWVSASGCCAGQQLLHLDPPALKPRRAA